MNKQVNFTINWKLTKRLSKKSVILFSNLVDEYRQSMKIKAQFAQLVQQLAENDSQESQRSQESDHFSDSGLVNQPEDDQGQDLLQDQDMLPAKLEVQDDDVTVIEN